MNCFDENFNIIFNAINYHNCMYFNQKEDKNKIYNDFKLLKIRENNIYYIDNYKTYYWYYFINLIHKDYKINKDYCLYGKFMIYTYNIDEDLLDKFKQIILSGLCQMIKYSNKTYQKSKTICIYTDNNPNNIIDLAKLIINLKVTNKDIPFRANWQINNFILNNNKIMTINKKMMLSNFINL